jgi:general secretion pathway protein G
MRGPGIAYARTRRSAPRARSAAYTLVEILLVVALVAVLAAIALPAYQSYRERIRIASAVMDIKVLDATIQSFRMNTDRLPDELDEVGWAGRLDPWGNPYRYTNLGAVNGNGKARKNKNLVPINTDFDLWSDGPDGRSVGPLTASQSRDDIVRANDGRFIGPAKDYDP